MSPRRLRPDAGFGLVEVLFSSAILVIAVLGNASSVSTAHSTFRAVEERGRAVEVMARFLERMRGDDDWAGLYARMRVKSRETEGDTGRTGLGVDPELRMYAPTAYYPDFTVPEDLGTVSFLVQVPGLSVGGSLPTLRESQDAPRYGLPADLNGDGEITSESREGDYRALPVVLRMRWTRRNGASEELVLPTWLRGER
jgi:hypothetical protein